MFLVTDLFSKRPIVIALWIGNCLHISPHTFRLEGKKKSKLIETWLETEGVLVLNFVNQGKKNKTKPHKPFTIFHQYPAVPFLN